MADRSESPLRLLSSPMNHIPTLEDLRVKSCFICLEKESASVRPKLPEKRNFNTWIHPCPSCALIAHDRCLLRWIGSLPPATNKEQIRTRSVFALNTFKCPHCGRRYELVQPPPGLIHRFAMTLDATYVLLVEMINLGCAAAGLLIFQTIPVTLSVGTRLSVLTAMFVYEVAFLESYLGPQMFDLLLSDDLLRSLFIILPTLPLRLLLPGTVAKWIIPLYLSFPFIFRGLIEPGALRTLAAIPTVYTTSRPMISTWPPSPAMLGLFIVPLIAPMYDRLFSRFKTWVLGAPPPRRQKRYLTDRARWMFIFGRTPAAPAAAPPLAPPAGDALVQDLDPPPLVIADQLIHKDQASLTHDIVHALSTIVVPRTFGVLLHAASNQSVYLRHFLGLRPRLVSLPRGVHSYYYPNWSTMTLSHRVLAAFQAIGGLFLGGSWVWADVDPVWWRNTLGYGLFVLTKDCFQLYRLWLQKQEVQSRSIKSRDFAGVDVAELDLVAPERFS
ncbi:hypothetical protein C8F04DRAFT_1118859 [Mycena alexandri]|uniref:RING-CH-type domain-containing protein n=1 Tax=Mycena alexandri TaxID=1745969 RepID=A0AAD6SI71_9AGAR|nr:hypothetical protein C8F04DRAFT_1118859 [Mycena alexandri]